MNMKRALLILLAVGLVACGCEEDDCCTRSRCVCEDDIAPAIPAGVYSVTGDELVTVYWNPVLGSDVKGYGIWRNTTYEGEYDHVADALGEESDFYEDQAVDNGVTYYYAVTAFDFEGNESDLSLENAHDTPRPEGSNLRLYTVSENPSKAGVDLTIAELPAVVSGDLVVAWDDAGADIYLESSQVGKQDILRIVTADNAFIQDFGHTEHLDEIDWAPEGGWSQSPLGVEVIAGHAYIIQTDDGNFAKIRVTTLYPDHGSILLSWAYQLIANYQELTPPAPYDSRAGSSTPAEGR